MVIDKSDAIGTLKANGQYTRGPQDAAKQANTASAPIAGTAATWHRRYFHLGYGDVRRVAKVVHGMPVAEATPERAAGVIPAHVSRGRWLEHPSPSLPQRLRRWTSFTWTPLVPSQLQ